MLAGADEAIDLGEAALEIGREHYPGLEVAAYLARLDAMAAAVRAELAPESPTGAVVAAINRHLFAELGFRGNQDDYYDPRNSYLNEVLDRRTGIPITLCIIYLEVGKRLGLALSGVPFPGHFLVKARAPGGEMVIDPFSRGAIVSQSELERRIAGIVGDAQAAELPLAPLLAAASNRAILTRMLRNLKALYLQSERLELALWATDHILQLEPARLLDRRDRGLIYQRLECFRAALTDLRAYLRQRPDAEDAEDIRRRILELQSQASRLN
jgi:regulator of sirC expression with transglutaminase-like and TPR domain